MSARRVLVAALASALAAAPATAQGTPAPAAVTVWAAGGRDQALKSRIGVLHDRDLYLVGVRAAWPLARGAHATLTYTVDVLPVVLSTGMPSYAISGACAGNICTGEATQLTGRHTTYGAGVVPFGLTGDIALGRALLLEAGISGGVVMFAAPIPDPGERRFNFTGDGRAGLLLRLASHTAMYAGYRFNHISNGGAGPVNPGMNSHLLELGVTRWRGAAGPPR